MFSKLESELTDKDYSVKRLLDVARRKEIEIKLVRPEQFELVRTRSDTKSIVIDDTPEPLPDFVIPRMGSDTTYYAFSVIRQLQYLGSYICNDSNFLRKEFSEPIKNKLWGNRLWSSSYCVVSTGGVSIDVVKQYIKTKELQHQKNT